MLKILDKKRFLGVDFWEFGIRSMSRRVGVEIIGRLFFSHPIKSVRAFLRYRHYLAQGKPNPTEAQPPPFSDRGSTSTILIGAYCQKPKGCPVGRFNHRCLFAETLTTYSPCESCDLKKMAELAMAIESPFYIMTTALDVFIDIFLGKTFSCFLLMICAYARELFLFLAFVFNMKGQVFTLGKGSCRNYQAFLLADMGGKLNQTFLSPIAHKSFASLYKEIKGSNNYHRLIRKGHFYLIL